MSLIEYVPPGVTGGIVLLYYFYQKGHRIEVSGENIILWKWFKKKREMTFSELSAAKQRWVRTTKQDQRSQVNGFISHYDVYDQHNARVFKLGDQMNASYFEHQLKEHGLIHYADYTPRG